MPNENNNYIHDKVTMKVILLYICENMDSLSHEEFINVALESMYMDYFQFTTLLKELVEENLISGTIRKKESNSRTAPVRYSLTQSGLAVLNSLRSNIPQAMKKYLQKILANTNEKVNKDNNINSFYKLKDNGNYSINLTLNEDDNNFFKLELEVPSLNDAQMICSKWKENSSTIYPQIIYFLGLNTKNLNRNSNDKLADSSEENINEKFM